MRGWAKRTLLGIVVVFGAIQLVPYGHTHTVRPVLAEPKWPTPETRALAKRACFDCHANETTWPWYAHVAPVSWLVQHDVDEGREVLNYSEWRGATKASREAGEEMREGEMPPWYYVALHPKARLTATDKDVLARDLSALQ
jgi:hypothetical protein